MPNDIPERVALDLSSAEAAIVFAALRQYEPYWSSNDPEGAAKLSELAADIKRLLHALQSRVPTSSPPV